MEIEEMSEILSMRLASFRTWPHSTLAERVERNNRTGERLESGEGVGSDSTPYQMKFNAYWDDKRHGNIRVCGSLSLRGKYPPQNHNAIFLHKLSERMRIH